LRKIPTKNGRPQYGATVDEANGQLYFFRSGAKCGVDVNMWRVPVATPGGSLTRIVAFPDGVDTGWTLDLAPGTGATFGHDGERVVRGQRWMQTVSDILLGWTTIEGRAYLVRQFRDMKGSIDPTALKPHQLDDYARVVGVVLQETIERDLVAAINQARAGDGCAVELLVAPALTAAARRHSAIPSRTFMHVTPGCWRICRATEAPRVTARWADTSSPRRARRMAWRPFAVTTRVSTADEGIRPGWKGICTASRSAALAARACPAANRRSTRWYVSIPAAEEGVSGAKRLRTVSGQIFQVITTNSLTGYASMMARKDK